MESKGPRVTRITHRFAKSILQGYNPTKKYSDEAARKLKAEMKLDAALARSDIVVKGVPRARQLYESPDSLVYLIVPDLDAEWLEQRPDACAKWNQLMSICSLIVRVPIELIPEPPPEAVIVHLDIVLSAHMLSAKSLESLNKFEVHARPLALFLDQPLKNVSTHYREVVLHDLTLRKKALKAINYTGKYLDIRMITKKDFDAHRKVLPNVSYP